MACISIFITYMYIANDYRVLVQISLYIITELCAAPGGNRGWRFALECRFAVVEPTAQKAGSMSIAGFEIVL